MNSAWKDVETRMEMRKAKKGYDDDGASEREPASQPASPKPEEQEEAARQEDIHRDTTAPPTTR